MSPVIVKKDKGDAVLAINITAKDINLLYKTEYCILKEGML